jgi:hypothetical protein
VSEESAECRGCKMRLDGKPYYMGGNARDPVTNKLCKINYYGGYVCSEDCYRRSCAEQEDSMPGHGHGSSQRHGISSAALQRIRENWSDL